MSELQEELARTSAVVRLGSIVRAFGSNDPARHVLPATDREWFVQLLAPLAADESHARELASSRTASALDSSTIFDFVFAGLERSGGQQAQFRARVEALLKLLRTLLQPEAPLDGDDQALLCELARALRRRFLEVDTAWPGADERANS